MRRRIIAERAQQFLAQLATLNFRIEPPPSVTELPRLQALADRHQLTACDVAYLELAVRLGLPLATCDSASRKAAGAGNIELLG